MAKIGKLGVYEYLFAKQDRANIDDDELADFRKLTKPYGNLTKQQIDQMLQNNDWMEICNGNNA